MCKSPSQVVNLLRAEGWEIVPFHCSWSHLLTVSDAHGERDLLRKSESVRELAQALQPLAEKYLSAQAVPISALWFDKLPEANWQVPWHQDLLVPVEPFSSDGWGPWVYKTGIPYVQLPPVWSRRRIALRLALDECMHDNGPLEVLSGSHTEGILHPSRITELAEQQFSSITMHAGEILVMHPLILHRSRPARSPAHRRVLHLEWCDLRLPEASQWLNQSL